jgi:hypothetical protein
MDNDMTMTKEQMAMCFNEWMQRYVDDPQSFEVEFQTVARFLTEDDPTYGDECAAYMFSILE